METRICLNCDCELSEDKELFCSPECEKEMVKDFEEFAEEYEPWREEG
jgi:hypothetical protein